jgi:hypothetical protein
LFGFMLTYFETQFDLLPDYSRPFPLGLVDDLVICALCGKGMCLALVQQERVARRQSAKLDTKVPVVEPIEESVESRSSTCGNS